MNPAYDSGYSMISIILPIRNESAFIECVLQTILCQDYPTYQMEILIVDGMSTDNTRVIIQNFAAQHPELYIRILDNPGQIVPTGMNLALCKAKGEIILRVDGHCIIAPNYVRNCVNHLRVDQVDGVGGPMESIGENRISETIALAMSSPFGVGNSAFRTTTGKTMLVDTVPFPAYTREIIERAGLYDEELVRNQDDEYNYRIRQMGGKILLADDVRSKYYSRGSFGKLWRQYYLYGFYKVRVMQKHTRQMSVRQFIPLLFVITLILTTILTLAYRWGGWLLGGVVMAYLVANISASLLTAARQGWRHFALLPLTFAILHLSYGSGFLVGLFHFWNRWGDKVGKVPENS